MKTFPETSRALLLVAAVCMMALGSYCQSGKTVAASSDPSPPTKPAPATPIDKKKAELGGKTWDPEWDKIVEKAVPPEMLSSQVPRDVQRFCPRFYDMSETDKRAFWAYFFQALAGAEAGLNPKTRAVHLDPGIGRTQGLLQLTYEDEKRYGCEFSAQADRNLKPDDPSRTILRPKNNLECGIKILDDQIIAKRKPLLTKTSYWSTLQPARFSYRVFAKEMTNPPAACGLRVKSPVSPAETTQTVKQEATEAKDSH